jgi:hypothetical protein
MTVYIYRINASCTLCITCYRINYVNDIGGASVRCRLLEEKGRGFCLRTLRAGQSYFHLRSVVG